MSRSDTNIDVSVVIVNYRTAGLVIDCIGSLHEHTRGVRFETIVVDNDSGDDSLTRIAEAFGDRVITLPLDENIGFGRANNKGFDIARGRYLLCLNPDTILLNDALAVMVTFMDSHPEAGACGGNLFDADRRPTLSYRRFCPGVKWEINELLNMRPERLRYGRNLWFNHTGHPMTVGYITGADLMLRRDTLTQCGGYDPRFFMYYEDAELCLRIRRRGWKIYSVPEAHIIHLDGGSFGRDKAVSPARVARIEKGRHVYNRVALGFPGRAASDMFYFLTLASRSLLVRDPLKKERWRCRLREFMSLLSPSHSTD